MWTHRQSLRVSTTMFISNYGACCGDGDHPEGQAVLSGIAPMLAGGQRYVKVKVEANPYLPEYGRYF